MELGAFEGGSRNYDKDKDLRKAKQGLTHVSVKDCAFPFSVTASDDRSAAVS